MTRELNKTEREECACYALPALIFMIASAMAASMGFERLALIFGGVLVLVLLVGKCRGALPADEEK